jgi:hypothetical protein
MDGGLSNQLAVRFDSIEHLCALNVIHIHDVVPALHRIRPMTGYTHTDNLGNTGPAHVAHRRAAEIVEPSYRERPPLEGFIPCPPKILDRLPAVIKHQ